MSVVPSESYKVLVDALGKRLKEHGFRRSKSTFLKGYGRNFGVISFQSSDASSADFCKFTVNVGVVYGDLAEENRATLSIADAQLRERLGTIAYQKDVWWQITGESDVASLADEIWALLTEAALPYLLRFSETEAVANLWRSGLSPGLTATQRDRYLKKLDG